MLCVISYFIYSALVAAACCNFAFAFLYYNEMANNDLHGFYLLLYAAFHRFVAIFSHFLDICACVERLTGRQMAYICEIESTNVNICTSRCRLIAWRFLCVLFRDHIPTQFNNNNKYNIYLNFILGRCC